MPPDSHSGKGNGSPAKVLLPTTWLPPASPPPSYLNSYMDRAQERITKQLKEEMAREKGA